MPPSRLRPKHHAPPSGRWLVAGLAVALWPGLTSPAAAQSIGDWNGAYRAPAAKEDKQAPSPSPTPRIDAIPVIAATKSADHKNRDRAIRQTRPHHVSQAAGKAPSPAASPPPPPMTRIPAAPAPTPVSSPAAPPPPAAATPKFRLLPAPRPSHAVVPAAPPPGQDLPQWPLALTALLGGAAGWALWRRKGSASAGQAQSDPLPPAVPVMERPPPPVDKVKLPPPVSRPDLSIDFVPTRFATTLVEAVLRYRISVINRGTGPLGPLVIFGAMEAAGPEPQPSPAPPASPSRERPFRPAPGFNPHPHFTPYADLTDLGHGDPSHHDNTAVTPQPLYPARTELSAPGPAPLPECHRLAVLNPGEGADFVGQMRLPLTDITPIRVGGAALFVPLVRLKVEAGSAKGDHASGEAFTRELCVMVGEMAPGNAAPRPGETPPSLAPLPLDPEGVTMDHLAIRALLLPLAEESA